MKNREGGRDTRREREVERKGGQTLKCPDNSQIDNRLTEAMFHVCVGENAQRGG